MKDRAILIILGLFFVAVSFYSNAQTSANGQDIKNSEKFEYPVEVKAVIDHKCYGCHNPDSRSEKGKEKLNWVLLPGLDKAAKVAKLDKIIEMLDKGEMPPKKMIEMHPEAKISAEDSKIIKDWAAAASENLMK